ncbi:hypothetical protein GGS21DRAFT_248000 [Xylaria nigripes]|nr:hypothetical protein GGS21DRAFT_248000 [Xylaria nigripes]
MTLMTFLLAHMKVLILFVQGDLYFSVEVRRRVLPRVSTVIRYLLNQVPVGCLLGTPSIITTFRNGVMILIKNTLKEGYILT